MQFEMQMATDKLRAQEDAEEVLERLERAALSPTVLGFIITALHREIDACDGAWPEKPAGHQWLLKNRLAYINQNLGRVKGTRGVAAAALERGYRELIAPKNAGLARGELLSRAIDAASV